MNMLHPKSGHEANTTFRQSLRCPHKSLQAVWMPKNLHKPFDLRWIRRVTCLWESSEGVSEMWLILTVIEETPSHPLSINLDSTVRSTPPIDDETWTDDSFIGTLSQSLENASHFVRSGLCKREVKKLDWYQSSLRAHPTGFFSYGWIPWWGWNTYIEVLWSKGVMKYIYKHISIFVFTTVVRLSLGFRIDFFSVGSFMSACS